MDKSNGKFKESLASDVRGMLSLYEASQLRMHGEDVLEEALAFTKSHLERVIATQQSHHLVSRYLEQSFNRGIPRAEARVYISFYEEDKSHNDFILRFAKLDYNLLQIMYQKELKQLFRWDSGAIDQLPDCMKFVYRKILNLYDELHQDFDKFVTYDAVNYSKEAMKVLGKAYHLKAQWMKNKCIPLYGEYIKVYATGLDLVITSGFIGMFDCVNEETFKWMQGNPKLLEAAETIARLYNDITDMEFDQRGGRAASAIECYKEEYGFTEEEAIEEVRKRIMETWKDLNEEYLKPSVVAPLRVREVFYNFCRSVDVMYKYEDGYNNPEYLKDLNSSLFVDPLPI